MRRLLTPVAALLVALTLVLPVAHVTEVHADVATITVIPDGSYNPGTDTLPQQSVAAGETADISAQVTLVQPVAGTNFSYQLFVSYDGGIDWNMPSQAFCAGGPNSKTGVLGTWSQSVDSDISGPALWYVQISFAKKITVKNTTASVTTTP